MPNWLNDLRCKSLAVHAGVLVVAVVVAGGIFASVASLLGGRGSIAVGLVAAGLCLAGALLALAINHLLRGPQFMLAGLLLGMIARMGIPLGLGLALHLRGGALAEAGFLYYLLLFYPVTLAVETILLLPPNRRATDSRTPGPNTKTPSSATP